MYPLPKLLGLRKEDLEHLYTVSNNLSSLSPAVAKKRRGLGAPVLCNNMYLPLLQVLRRGENWRTCTLLAIMCSPLLRVLRRGEEPEQLYIVSKNMFSLSYRC
jgi:hypothetical protein